MVEFTSFEWKKLHKLQFFLHNFNETDQRCKLYEIIVENTQKTHLR